MKAKLTKRKVDSIAPGKKDLKVWDTEIPGFGLKVTPVGRRVYVLQYWAPGQSGVRRTYTLGVHGSPVIRARNGVEETRDLTADLARDLAREARADVQRGADPAGVKGAARAATKTLTLSVLSTPFLEEVKAKRKPTTYRFYKNIVNAQLIPEFGRTVVTSISYDSISSLHLRLVKKPVYANRVVAVLGAFLTWCMKNLYRPHELNPCDLIDKYEERSRERFLSPEEFARLGAALTTAASVGLPTGPEYAEYRKKENKKPENQKHRTKASMTPRVADPFGVAAIRFLTLTGWRSSEAFQLKWAIVDLDRGAIGLPDTKTGKSERFIGEDAVRLLRDMPRTEGSPYVFPGPTGSGKSPLSSVQRLWYSARAAAQLPGVRVHDLRHSFASVGVGSGESLYIVGKLLGHKHAVTTQRYAHLADNVAKRAADSVSRTVADAFSPGVSRLSESSKRRSGNGAKRQKKKAQSPRQHALRGDRGKAPKSSPRKGTRQR